MKMNKDIVSGFKLKWFHKFGTKIDNIKNLDLI